MAEITATNNHVWIIRDETPKESSGLILTELGKTKPHTGEIKYVGKLVSDPEIKKGVGKKALWHSTVGQELDFEGTIYLILVSEHILGVV